MSTKNPNNRKKRESYKICPKHGVTVATLSGVRYDFISAMDKLTSRNSRYFSFVGFDTKLKDMIGANDILLPEDKEQNLQ